MIEPVTIQKQIFDTRDDKEVLQMKIFKIMLGVLAFFIGMYFIIMFKQKPKEIYFLALLALFGYFGAVYFNKIMPYKIFMF